MLSPAGVSCGTLYAVRISISLLSLPNNMNPHHRPNLPAIFRYNYPTSGPVMPIMLPPGLVNKIIGALEDEVTV